MRASADVAHKRLESVTLKTFLQFPLFRGYRCRDSMAGDMVYRGMLSRELIEMMALFILTLLPGATDQVLTQLSSFSSSFWVMDDCDPVGSPALPMIPCTFSTEEYQLVWDPIFFNDTLSHSGSFSSLAFIHSKSIRMIPGNGRTKCFLSSAFCLYHIWVVVQGDQLSFLVHAAPVTSFMLASGLYITASTASVGMFFLFVYSGSSLASRRLFQENIEAAATRP